MDKPLSFNRRSQNALAGIDVAIIASPYVTHPIQSHDATPRRKQNLLDVMLCHLANSGAKRATICIGPDARNIWTDRDYRGHDLALRHDKAARQESAKLTKNIYQEQSLNARNYTKELSWALTDLDPFMHDEWPISLDWAVDWRGQGNLALLAMALPLIRSNPVLVITGNRFLPANFDEFLAKHRRGGEQATILCHKMTKDDMIAQQNMQKAQSPETIESPETITEILNDHKHYAHKISIDDRGRVDEFLANDDHNLEREYLLGGMYLFEHDYLTNLCKLVQTDQTLTRIWSIERDGLANRDSGSFAAYIDAAPINWPDTKTQAVKKKLADHSDKIVAFPENPKRSSQLYSA